MAAPTSVPDCEIVNETSWRGNVDLPEDLVIDILCRLPVKSLGRFKIVCNSWKVLIDSPGFVEKHLRNKTGPESLLIIRGDDRGVKYSVGTCNGIICFHVFGPNPLILYNPCSREFSVLPEECKGHCYGFFYLSQTQEYKVVCFTGRKSREDVMDVKILTFGTTISFREVKDIVLPAMIGRDNSFNPAIFDTFMVWLGYKNEQVLVCYDVLEERFSRMELPQYRYPTKVTNVFMQSAELLVDNSVIRYFYPDDGGAYFEIWTLVNDDDAGSKGKTWVKRKKVGPSKPAIMIYPVYVSSDLKLVICKKTIDYCTRRKNGIAYETGELFYYDFETNQVIDYEAEVDIRQFTRYVESLVSPNHLYPSVQANHIYPSVRKSNRK